MLFLLAGLVGLVCWVWMLIKTSKSSMVVAVIAFFFWPAFIYALVKNWNDEESDIKVPFFVWLGAVFFMVIFANRAAKAMDDQESLLGIMRLFA